ncbi:MAG TPA: VF530 family protein [Flavobacterium sp.]|nr:VF530 family protein [Flavobacterium sp.]
MQNTDPLHGKTLQAIVEYLVDYYGFKTLGTLIKIKCFTENPSIKSSLTFLRKTDWARKKVEELYIDTITKKVSFNDKTKNPIA